MNTDIRLLVNFKGHRKRKRLKMLLGDGYLDYLIDLWLTIAEDRPDGILIGWDKIDIALSAGWEGDDPDKLIDALMDCGFIEKNGQDQYVIHDWDEHQGWACGAKLRSERAKTAAQARWGINSEKCPSIADAMPEQCLGNAPSPSPSPSPNPYPNPSHTTSKKNTKLTVHQPNPKKKERECSLPADFNLSLEGEKYALMKGIDIKKVDDFFDSFLNWAKAKGIKCVDWEAQFRIHCDNAPKFARQYMTETKKKGVTL